MPDLFNDFEEKFISKPKPKSSIPIQQELIEANEPKPAMDSLFDDFEPKPKVVKQPEVNKDEQFFNKVANGFLSSIEETEFDKKFSETDFQKEARLAGEDIWKEKPLIPQDPIGEALYISFGVPHLGRLAPLAYSALGRVKGLIVSKQKGETFDPFEGRMLSEMLPTDTPADVKIASYVLESVVDIGAMQGLNTVAKEKLLKTNITNFLKKEGIEITSQEQLNKFIKAGASWTSVDKEIARAIKIAQLKGLAGENANKLGGLLGQKSSQTMIAIRNSFPQLAPPTIKNASSVMNALAVTMPVHSGEVISLGAKVVPSTGAIPISLKASENKDYLSLLKNKLANEPKLKEALQKATTIEEKEEVVSKMFGLPVYIRDKGNYTSFQILNQDTGHFQSMAFFHTTEAGVRGGLKENSKIILEIAKENGITNPKVVGTNVGKAVGSVEGGTCTGLRVDGIVNGAGDIIREIGMVIYAPEVNKPTSLIATAIHEGIHAGIALKGMKGSQPEAIKEMVMSLSNQPLEDGTKPDVIKLYQELEGLLNSHYMRELYNTDFLENTKGKLRHRQAEETFANMISLQLSRRQSWINGKFPEWERLTNAIKSDANLQLLNDIKSGESRVSEKQLFDNLEDKEIKFEENVPIETSKKKVEALLNDKHVIISAVDPMNKPIIDPSPDVPKEVHDKQVINYYKLINKMWREVRAMGYEPIQLLFYTPQGIESSFLIPKMSTGEANELMKRYRQASYITNGKMVNSDGTIQTIDESQTRILDKFEMYSSSIVMDGNVLGFSLKISDVKEADNLEPISDDLNEMVDSLKVINPTEEEKYNADLFAKAMAGAQHPKGTSEWKETYAGLKALFQKHGVQPQSIMKGIAERLENRAMVAIQQASKLSPDVSPKEIESLTALANSDMTNALGVRNIIAGIKEANMRTDTLISQMQKEFIDTGGQKVLTDPKYDSAFQIFIETGKLIYPETKQDFEKTLPVWLKWKNAVEGWMDGVTVIHGEGGEKIIWDKNQMSKPTYITHILNIGRLEKDPAYLEAVLQAGVARGDFSGIEEAKARWGQYQDFIKSGVASRDLATWLYERGTVKSVDDGMALLNATLQNGEPKPRTSALHARVGDFPFYDPFFSTSIKAYERTTKIVALTNNLGNDFEKAKELCKAMGEDGIKVWDAIVWSTNLIGNAQSFNKAMTVFTRMTSPALALAQISQFLSLSNTAVAFGVANSTKAFFNQVVKIAKEKHLYEKELFNNGIIALSSHQVELTSNPEANKSLQSMWAQTGARATDILMKGIGGKASALWMPKILDAFKAGKVIDKITLARVGDVNQHLSAILRKKGMTDYQFGTAVLNFYKQNGMTGLDLDKIAYQGAVLTNFTSDKLYVPMGLSEDLAQLMWLYQKMAYQQMLFTKRETIDRILGAGKNKDYTNAIIKALRAFLILAVGNTAVYTGRQAFTGKLDLKDKRGNLDADKIAKHIGKAITWGQLGQLGNVIDGLASSDPEKGLYRNTGIAVGVPIKMIVAHKKAITEKKFGDLIEYTQGYTIPSILGQYGGGYFSVLERVFGDQVKDEVLKQLREKGIEKSKPKKSENSSIKPLKLKVLRIKR